MEVSDYINKAMTFAENAAKLSQKMSQGLVENARELGFPGASDSSAQYFDTSDEKMRNIKRQLDAKNDREKLDGLKRLIAMISKGRDVSEFFPDVVKNVVAQNIEVRKLVYIYLLRYAEQEPDLALLSVNSFQKDLSDKNQIIRAMALRVMSGIRVPVISPIVLLGIKKCATDSSPYVRKTAAHAIPKCYSLDPTQKEALVDIIATMMKDRSTITLGSTLMAFNELCPTRFDLIHPCFRKLCSVLDECDEWGQMAILGVLLRYGRHQFLNPNPQTQQNSSSTMTTITTRQNRRGFYSDTSDDEQEVPRAIDTADTLDPDHDLLLKSCLPLFQSRNSGVVLAVARLFYHLAPAAQANTMARPLLRLMRSHRELQYVVLSNIAAMAKTRPFMFQSSLQQFYAQSSEPVFIRNTKLDILTSIATETNIEMLLNELQQYIKSQNKDFVAASIQAIARCSTRVPSATDRCLRLLMKLLHSSNDLVVAESVLVVTRLLREPLEDNKRSVMALAKLMETIKVPMARASILWLVGQYAEVMPRVGPDVLRQAVKNFTQETNTTKLQILSLSAKLICLDPTHTTLDKLNQYVLNLARYDLNYDVRDRARLLRVLTLPDPGKETPGVVFLKSNLKQILLTEKEPPVVKHDNEPEFTIGSLSLLAGQSLPDYEPLADYPEKQPDPSVRDIVELEGWSGSRTMIIEKGFGSDGFESRYRGGSSFSGTSTAVSGVVASGLSSAYGVRKGNNYDLEAFYDERSEEESAEESAEESEEESEEESAEESAEESEEESEKESEEESEKESEKEAHKSRLIKK
ncbi:adaptin N terminal region-domain-containing protein [Spinellus fusiger]|nr:adaptin N terminal region-domain-containing protein [Spinellus fusiger]